MAWDTLKEGLLGELAQRIDSRAEAADQQSLHSLSAAFYSRFPAEDMKGRSVAVSYTHLTLPTIVRECSWRWARDH